MQLKDYFSQANGVGVLSTADKTGKVDAAIYAKPHVMSDGTIAFIMRDRLTYHNLKENPHASYLFKEAVNGYKGIRLFLKKVKEETDAELIQKMTRRSLSPEEDEAKGLKFLVCFDIERTLNLIGDGLPDITMT